MGTLHITQNPGSFFLPGKTFPKYHILKSSAGHPPKCEIAMVYSTELYVMIEMFCICANKIAAGPLCLLLFVLEMHNEFSFRITLYSHV